MKNVLFGCAALTYSLLSGCAPSASERRPDSTDVWCEKHDIAALDLPQRPLTIRPIPGTAQVEVSLDYVCPLTTNSRVGFDARAAKILPACEQTVVLMCDYTKPYDYFRVSLKGFRTSPEQMFIRDGRIGFVTSPEENGLLGFHLHKTRYGLLVFEQ